MARPVGLRGRAAGSGFRRRHFRRSEDGVGKTRSLLGDAWGDGVAAGAGIRRQAAGLGVDFQEPATPIMERVHSFHDLLLWIITAIVDLRAGAAVYVMGASPRSATRCRPDARTTRCSRCLDRGAGADPGGHRLCRRSSCSTSWTASAETELTIKATGHQWYWSYEYPDNGDFTFDANMIADERPEAGPAAPARDRQPGGACRSTPTSAC